MKFLIATVLMGFLLSGCTQTVNTKVTAFNALTSPLQGTVSIHADGADLEASLEFQHYRSAAAKIFTQHGFNVIDADSGRSDYHAVLGFGVQEAQPKDDGIKSGVVWRTSPWRSFGTDIVMIDDNGNKREYRRKLSLTISDNAADKRVYEATAVSLGSCDVLTVVFDEMLEAILKLYPQQSGTVQTVKVAGETRC